MNEKAQAIREAVRAELAYMLASEVTSVSDQARKKVEADAAWERVSDLL